MKSTAHYSYIFQTNMSSSSSFFKHPQLCIFPPNLQIDIHHDRLISHTKYLTRNTAILSPFLRGKVITPVTCWPQGGPRRRATRRYRRLNLVLGGRRRAILISAGYCTAIVKTAIAPIYRVVQPRVKWGAITTHYYKCLLLMPRLGPEILDHALYRDCPFPCMIRWSIPQVQN